MLPQSSFTIMAPIAREREDELRALLESMNASPGIADPRNAVLPFGDFERLHFARWVIQDDATLGDLTIHGRPTPSYPKYLAFMGDCDGSSNATLAELSQRAGEGLRTIFSHCVGFEPGDDLYGWMRSHDVPSAVVYVNWVGRTVRQIREEAALQRALSARVERNGNAGRPSAEQTRRDLRAFANAEVAAGRLALTPAEATPLAWQIRKLAHLIGIPVAALLASPVIIALLPLAMLTLRERERSDPETNPRPDASALEALRRLEDHDVSNQFSALGSVKPGLFRKWLVSLSLLLTNYAARHVFTRGHLGRVQTIHFARWVFIDNRARMIFASSYDGGHEAYMDDFVNKVAFGLNLTFSHGVGWPRTDWLIKRGARNEGHFKRFQRRHQIPSQVWYKAYPGLTLTDLVRNQRIREGLERSTMSEADAIEWLRLL
jgi:hypothetical protein